MEDCLFCGIVAGDVPATASADGLAEPVPGG
jgi:hypothetical protein